MTDEFGLFKDNRLRFRVWISLNVFNSSVLSMFLQAFRDYAAFSDEYWDTKATEVAESATDFQYETKKVLRFC